MLKRGFTLIEVLVTTLIVTIAIVGVLGGIRAIEFTNAKVQNADLLQRLAEEKMNEVRILPDPGTAANSGTFAEQGHGEISWTTQVSNTATDDVEQVTVTATLGPATESLSTLMYVASARSGG